MPPSLISRSLRFFITSIICSLPIFIGQLLSITDNGILFFSFIVFAIEIGIDSYHFSFVFLGIENYCFYQLLPLVIYLITGFFTCLLFPPFIFNRIFLPLRFAGIFGMSTIASIAITSIIFIVIVTVLRFFGARAGRLFANM